jgi:hypothetical protein
VEFVTHSLHEIGGDAGSGYHSFVDSGSELWDVDCRLHVVNNSGAPKQAARTLLPSPMNSSILVPIENAKLL